MGKPFASSADVEEKLSTLEELAPGVVAFTAEGDPNVGAVIGDEAVLAIDARATPTHAREWLDELRRLTETPVRYLVLTHYHAVRVLGASAFDAEWVIAHEGTRRWILERGEADFESETRRFPRLFRDVGSIPGLTYPNVSFGDLLRLELGGRTVELLFLGRGHTQGDAAVWLPDERVLFAGDLVEARAAPYMGDAFIQEWSTTTLDRLEDLGAQTIVPGRGPAAGAEAVSETREYLQRLWDTVRGTHRRGSTLKDAFDAARAALEPRFGDWWIFEHCLPFNVARAWDEAHGIAEPQVWTAEKDSAVWT
ncbi:MAG: MBL fold metallo-hydrolase, partial [Actinomycetota bacterium]|nr:MBL fold metallo-hydrolase [Actinomycetota bacterium]